MKITQWLFIFCLILFPFGEVIRISLFKDIFIKPLDVAVGLTFVSYCFHVLIHGNIKKSALFWPIIYFVGICVLSLAVNAFTLNTQQLLVSFSYIVRWTMYAGLFFVVLSFNQSFKKQIVSWLIVIGTLFLFLGFAQYIWYPDLRNLFYLGWDEHLYRLFSTFLDPNFSGSFLVLFLLFVYSLYIQRDKHKKILLVLILLIFIGILLTYSRSAYLMLLVSGSLLLLLQKKIKLLLMLGATLLVFIFLSTKFISSEGTNILRTSSTFSRVDSYAEAMHLIKLNPVFGVGFNSYKYALEKNNTQKPVKALEQHGNTSTDSSLLFVFATTGIIGLTSYLYLTMYILFIFYMRYKQRNILALNMFVGFVGLLVNSFFINSLFYPFIMFWLWSLLGIIETD